MSNLITMQTQLIAAVNLPSAWSSQPGFDQLGTVITNIFTFLLWVVGVIGIAMITYAGFMYITSAGNPQKTKMAFQSILYTVIGFVIALMAQSIVNFVIPQAQGAPNVQTLVANGMQIFMWIIGIAAVVMVIVGGLLYVTSGGDPGRTKTAKDAILYAVVGLIVAIMGGAIITFVQAQL